MNTGPRTPRPRALLVTRDPSRHLDTTLALVRRGMALIEAQDDREVLRGLARRPMLVLVDLTFCATLSARTVERINRLRGRALVMALHEGSLGSTPSAYAELSVDGFCLAGCEGAGWLSKYAPGPVHGEGWLQTH